LPVKNQSKKKKKSKTAEQSLDFSVVHLKKNEKSAK